MKEATTDEIKRVTVVALDECCVEVELDSELTLFTRGEGGAFLPEPRIT